MNIKITPFDNFTCVTDDNNANDDFFWVDKALNARDIIIEVQVKFFFGHVPFIIIFKLHHNALDLFVFFDEVSEPEP